MDSNQQTNNGATTATRTAPPRMKPGPRGPRGGSTGSAAATAGKPVRVLLEKSEGGFTFKPVAADAIITEVSAGMFTRWSKADEQNRAISAELGQLFTAETSGSVEHGIKSKS